MDITIQTNSVKTDVGMSAHAVIIPPTTVQM